MAGHPALILEVAFTTEPLTGSPSWTDVSSYLMDWTVDRGRIEELGRFNAGKATFVLNNLDRRFEPFYTSGAYSPNVLPRRRIRLRTASYPIFDGFVDDWQPSYPGGGLMGVCTVICSDLLSLLANIQLQVPYVREVLLDTPYAYWRLNESSGLSLVDHTGNGHGGAYTATGVTYQVGDAITDSENGAVTFDGVNGWAGVGPVPFNNTMAVEAWFKTTADTFGGQWFIFDQGAVTNSGTFVGSDLRLSINHTGFVTFFVGRATGVDWQVSTSTGGYNDGEWHHVVGLVDISGADLFLWIDGADDSAFVVKTGTPTAVTNPLTGIGARAASADGRFDGSVSDVAAYSGNHPAVATHYAARNAGLGDTTGDRITRVTNYAAIPLAMTVVPDGLSEMTSAPDMAGQKALEAIRVAELTEAGALFAARDGILTFRDREAPLGGTNSITDCSVSQATFGGDGVGDAQYIGNPVLASSVYGIANVVRNSRLNGTSQVAQDTDSKDKYGELAKNLSTASGSDSEALSRAQWELAHLKDPDKLRVRRIDFLVTTTNEAVLLDRELHDRVTVSWSPPGGGSAISHEALITKVSHTYNAAKGAWNLSMEVSPVETQAYWVWGTSEWGETTRWSF